MVAPSLPRAPGLSDFPPRPTSLVSLTPSKYRLLEEVGGISASFYHAGMTPKKRESVQNAWRAGEVQVVVATIAFGMGIDHPNVRFVVRDEEEG